MFVTSYSTLDHSMNNLTLVGRFLLAIAVLAFGIQHIIYAAFGSGLGPPWIPESRILIYLIAAFFTIAGMILISGKLAWMMASGVAVACFWRAMLYIPQLVAAPRDPRPWTSGSELLAISAGALILATTLEKRSAYRWRAGNPLGILFQLGRFLFVASLVVFAVQHAIYGAFIATLIPVWLPSHLIWAYSVGAAFLAAAIAIITGKLAPLAAGLLGTMFFLWVVILHAPRVAGALHNGDEWTSLVVALAMSGCSFVIAGAMI